MPVSMCCWYKPASLGVAHALVSVDVGGISGGSGVERWTLLKNAIDTAQAFTATFGVSNSANGAVAVVADRWYHFAAVFSANNSRVCYLDGGDKATNTNSVTPTGTDNIRIGTRNASGLGLPANGLIAEVAVWRIALGDGEIAMLAGGALPMDVNYNSLRYYYPLDAQTGSYEYSKAYGRDVNVMNPTISTNQPRYSSELPPKLRRRKPVKYFLMGAADAGSGSPNMRRFSQTEYNRPVNIGQEGVTIA